MNDYFYGWYFRCQGEESIAVIPAVHLGGGKGNCSIQVVTEAGSLYQEFPIDQFRISPDRESMQIGENLFSKKGIRLNLEASLPEKSVRSMKKEFREDLPGCKRLRISGLLRFGEFARPKYDIMGPFSRIPGMECRHAVYSMKHTVNGELKLGKKTIRFVDGDGYMEGDSGTSFPQKYIWTQHFLKEGSFMTAAASIPLGGICFNGTVGFLYWRNREYRFATYLGARIRKMKEGELLIQLGRFTLRIRLKQKHGHVLNAPDNGRMIRKIQEDIACGAEYTLMYRNHVLLHTITDKAAAEYETEEEQNEDYNNHSRKNKRKISERRHRGVQ